jgi:hypothetical protein
MRMRSIPPLMLAIGLFSLPALAAERHPAGHAAPAAMPASHQTVVGQVVLVDAKDRAITLKEGNKEMRYTLAPNAVVELGGKTVNLSEVKTGEQVRLTVQKDTTSASRLEVVPATPHPKKS